MDNCWTIKGQIILLTIKNDQGKNTSIEVGMNTDYNESTIPEDILTFKAKNLDYWIAKLEVGEQDRKSISMVYSWKEGKIESLDVLDEKPTNQALMSTSSGNGRPIIYWP